MKKTVLQQLREKEREVKKTLIVETAITLFPEVTPEDIHMKDIARATGISTPTLYQYFAGGREELLLAAFIQELQKVSDRINRLMESNPDISVEQIATAVLDHLLANEAGFRVIHLFMTKNTLSSDTLKKAQKTTDDFFSKIQSGFKRLGIRGNAFVVCHAFLSSIMAGLMIFKTYDASNSVDAKEFIYNVSVLGAKAFENNKAEIKTVL